VLGGIAAVFIWTNTLRFKFYARYIKVKVKVNIKEFDYRPGQALRVPGG
jgi:hypothetical protein